LRAAPRVQVIEKQVILAVAWMLQWGAGQSQ